MVKGSSTREDAVGPLIPHGIPCGGVPPSALGYSRKVFTTFLKAATVSSTSWGVWHMPT